MIVLIIGEFADAFKSHHFGHLCVGMHIVETVLSLRHGGKQSTVREACGSLEIFGVLGDGIGIGQYFVHAAMLIAQHLFHLCVVEIRCQVYSPVTETEE